jgi:MFS family permease
MGLLPGYAQIGVAAPLLLTLLRLVQGFSVGGEWGGAVLMASEFGDAKRRGWWAGWPQAGVPLGNMLAAAVLLVMAQAQSERDFVAWGWRVAFLLSAVLVAIGWWVRSRLNESPAFEAVARAQRVEKAPALVALRERPGGIAVGAGLRLGENICFYVMVTYSLAFLVEQVRVPYTLALAAVAVGAVAEALTLPVFAGLSDRIGRRPVYAFGAGGMALWIFAFFGLLQTGAALPILAAIVVGLVLHGAMYGPQAAFISELFPTRYRFSGTSIAYQLTSIFAGSLAPIIAIALYQQAKSTIPISIYVAGACVVSVIAALIARETKGLSLAEIDARHGA